MKTTFQTYIQEGNYFYIFKFHKKEDCKVVFAFGPEDLAGRESDTHV